jgi:hypothetical protein
LVGLDRKNDKPLRHMKEKYCKIGKDGKIPSTTINFLEVLIDD